jgi:hypothetical protein
MAELVAHRVELCIGRLMEIMKKLPQIVPSMWKLAHAAPPGSTTAQPRRSEEADPGRTGAGFEHGG